MKEQSAWGRAPAHIDGQRKPRENPESIRLRFVYGMWWIYKEGTGNINDYIFDMAGGGVLRRDILNIRLAKDDQLLIIMLHQS